MRARDDRTAGQDGVVVRARASSLARRTAAGIVGRLAGACRWLERLAGTWQGAAVLFVVALADFVVQAVAWPLVAGKNLEEYLLTYIQLLDRHPLLPWAPLFRGPGTGVVIGPLLAFDGGALAEPVAAVLFALSIVAWSAAALFFGRRAAILTACALLLYPGYGGLFHQFASEIVMATVFAAWALAVTRAMTRPSPIRFVVAGLGIALLVLIRPGNAVLVPFALFPLLLGARWRQRLAWTAAFTGAACLPLAAWTLQNGWRYGDYTLARGGNAVVPFYRTFVVDRIVSPSNGPASRRLAAAIEQHLLTRNPYKAYHVTLKDVFSSGSNRVHEDLYVLSDQVWGWKTAYSTLHDAALEAIEAHPTAYISGVTDTIWQQLTSPAYSNRIPGQHTQAGSAAAVFRGGLPAQDPHELIPVGEKAFISRPDQSIREVWTSPTTPTFVVLKPGEKRRFDQIMHDVQTLLGRFPDRSGNGWLQLRLNALAHRYPPPLLWLLLGVIALAIRRPRGAKILALVAFAALAVIVLNALGQTAEPRYMLPVAPAFVLLAAAALLGQTGQRAPFVRRRRKRGA
jgi:Dolichyl-phosphate-mannose-protein mannosyltransferase